MFKKETDLTSYKRLKGDIAVVMFKYVNPEAQGIKNHTPLSKEDLIDDGEFIFVEKEDLVTLLNSATELLVKLRQTMRSFYYLFGRMYCSKHCDNFDTLNEQEKIDTMTDNIIKIFLKRNIFSDEELTNPEKLKEDLHQILLEAIHARQAK